MLLAVPCIHKHFLNLDKFTLTFSLPCRNNIFSFSIKILLGAKYEGTFLNICSLIKICESYNKVPWVCMCGLGGFCLSVLVEEFQGMCSFIADQRADLCLWHSVVWLMGIPCCLHLHTTYPFPAYHTLPQTHMASPVLYPCQIYI